MNTAQKWIGVCLTEAYTEQSVAFLSALRRAGAGKNCRIIAYNALRRESAADPDPACITDAICFSRLTALVLHCDSFPDERQKLRVIRAAREAGVPVVCIGAVREGCRAVLDDYYTAYKEMLNHVLRAHGVTDTFFLGGLKQEDNSAFRLQCYREALEENGLPYTDDNVAFGEFNKNIIRRVTAALADGRARMPQAIFCADDTTAITVCDVLREKGFRVPEDVIVTGFGGIRAGDVCEPHLTTCVRDEEGLAYLALQSALEGTDGEVLRHAYKPRYAESCGCSGENADAGDIVELYRLMVEQVVHENRLYPAADRMLGMTDINELLTFLSRTILPGSAVCLSSAFSDAAPGNAPAASPQDLLVVPYAEEGASPLELKRVPVGEMIPDDPEDREGLYLVTPVHAGETVCGYYTARTVLPECSFRQYRREADLLNLVFHIILSRIRQRELMINIENSAYTDPMTGLPNLKGLTRWFEALTKDPENRGRTLALSVYCVPRYSFIYENYGIGDTEETVRMVCDSIARACPDALITARIADDQFVVVRLGTDRAAVEASLRESTQVFFPLIDAWNMSGGKPYIVEVNGGYTVSEDNWSEAALENLIRVALGEMILNKLKYGSDEAVKKPAVTDSEDLYASFSLLMDKNLFKYHFQPIVDAKTGSIYAYEALMRTDDMISLSPMQILKAAHDYKRLYDVERTTLFGIMDRYVRDYNSFRGSKVFINTIPGYFLNEKDLKKLTDRFEDYLDCFVFELTEQDSISDNELERIKQLCKPGSQAHIAVDDYGTGHSNIVNLLRYSPQVIKIDHYLISGIQNDTNKQMFVRNTIEFAHRNGIKALAEGVETLEELRTVIGFGIDLIQGFYTARPAEIPLQSLSEKVRGDIVEENVRLTRFDNEMLVYTARNGDTVNLFELAMQKYTFINILGGKVTVVGEKGHTVDMVIRIADNTETELTLDNVNIKGATETTLQLGRNCRTAMILRGSNTLNKEGILVPASSRLTLQGDGSLTVNNNRNYGVGIGANFNDPYGTVILDLDGRLTMRASGDKVVGIGGGASMGEGISFLHGTYDIRAQGINVVCVGSTGGNADIGIGNVRLNITAEGNDVVSVGTLAGHARITSAGTLKIVTDGERSTGIGTMSGTAEIGFTGGTVSSVIHCDIGACLGTMTGEARIDCRNTDLTIRGEGSRAVGFGSLSGVCETTVRSGVLRGEILSADAMPLGNEDSRMTVRGGNILLADPDALDPVSPSGKPLRPFRPEEDHFERTFRDGSDSWTYTADRDGSGELCVFIP